MFHYIIIAQFVRRGNRFRAYSCGESGSNAKVDFWRFFGEEKDKSAIFLDTRCKYTYNSIVLPR